MRTFQSVGIVGAALLAMSAVACGSATQGGTTDGGHGSPESGQGGADGSGSDAGADTGTLGPPTDAGTDANTGDAARGGSFIACPNPTPLVVNGQDTGFVQCGDSGVLHRANATSCPSLLPRGDAGVCMGSSLGFDAGAGVCSTDSDCTAKPLGTCTPGGGHFPMCGCTYGCVKDTDCAQGELCQCGDPVGTCVPATCTLDTSCQAGALCASSPVGWGGCSWSPLAQAYACESASDTCLTNADCTAMDPSCGLSPDSGLRACGPPQLACPGRPFLVERVARVAGITRRRDWVRRGVSPATDSLSPDVKQRLAEHWTRTAQMEHASVAAFARFALELLALGAPADLLVATNEAMADEVEHARLAYALASAYGGAEVGPGPLAMDGALGSVSPERVFAQLVREGCIGETLAAVLATEASATAKDETVGVTLTQIAEDETKHAALAWRAARWMVEQGGEAFRAWAEAETARAIGEHSIDESGGPDVSEEDSLTDHGVVDRQSYRELTRAVLRDVVEPAARRLCASSAAARRQTSSGVASASVG